MLVRCLYASRPAADPTPAMLDAILDQSRRNNPRRGITGLLCHADSVFVQVLEGGRDPVSELLALIMRDSRHEGVRILVWEEIVQRRFGNWTMGQINVGKMNTAQLLKYYDKAELNPFACPGAATLAFLEDMVSTASIVSRGS